MTPEDRIEALEEIVKELKEEIDGLQYHKCFLCRETFQKKDLNISMARYNELVCYPCLVSSSY